MSATTLRIVIALVLFIHGVGHAMGIMPALGLSTSESWHSRSWLLTGLLGESVTRVIGMVLFLVALVGFVGAALGLMGWLVPHELWRPLAVWSAIISLVAIILFWNAFVALFPNKLGAIAVDVALLVCLLWLNWPAEVDIGY